MFPFPVTGTGNEGENEKVLTTLQEKVLASLHKKKEARGGSNAVPLRE